MSEYIERLIHFTGLRVRPLDGGGVYLNVGRARKDVTTVNFDFLDHYRPRVNVVGRPHLDAGGPGIGLRGHQELMLPLVAAALLEREP
jgi:hypothetical protein